MKASGLPAPQATLVDCLDQAIRWITAPDAITDEGAHEARKALKKARAALRLLRPTFGDDQYRFENSALRSAARTVGPLRDVKVQLDLIARLRRDRRALEPLEVRARERLVRAHARIHPRTSRIRRAAATLALARKRAQNRRIGGASREAIDVAVQRLYRKARAAFAKAQKRTSATSLHEWRKATKYLLNAISMLAPANSAQTRTFVAEAERLGDWLGEEHDLAVLAANMRADGDLLEPGAAETLGAAIDRRRHHLRRKALRQGATLFAAKAGRFAVVKSAAKR